MIEALLIALGGFFGAISRYVISKKIQDQNKSEFPLGTLTVNLIGAFLLGFIYGNYQKGHIYTLFGIGFMGAFTTFSTFKLESLKLRTTGRAKLFYSYLLISYTAGILLAFIGLIIGKRV